MKKTARLGVYKVHSTQGLPCHSDSE